MELPPQGQPVPPSAMRSGSSPPWAASTTSPRRSLPTIRIWSPAPSRACTPSPIPSAAARPATTMHRPASCWLRWCATPMLPPFWCCIWAARTCSTIQFVEELGEYDHDRVKFLTCQEVDDEFTAARDILKGWLPMPGSSSVSLSRVRFGGGQVRRLGRPVRHHRQPHHRPLLRHDGPARRFHRSDRGARCSVPRASDGSLHQP